MIGGKDKHKYASIVIHDLYSNSKVLLVFILFTIDHFMLFQLFY